MKQKGALLIVLLLAFSTAQSCPTCLGALEDGSPSFFSEESYRPQKTDAVLLDEGGNREEPEFDDNGNIAIAQ